MIRPPPSSTLFPYPTLSRSPALSRSKSVKLATPPAAFWLRVPVRLAPPGFVPIAIVTSVVALVTVTIAIGDRKSTRLNSSHQIISYAVFCLKKKIQHTHSPNHHDRLVFHLRALTHVIALIYQSSI